MTSLFTQLKQQLSPAAAMRCVLLASLPALLFYGFSLAGFSAAGFEAMEILRDPAQQSGQSSFLGFLSNIGVWLWVASFSICFFAAITSDFVAEGSHRELLLLVGMLSLVLAVDDFFMIHDRYASQKMVYLLYAVLASALLVRHHKTIFKIDGFAFLFAGALLALSIVTDVTIKRNPFDYATVQIYEEGFKFVGGATWLYFAARLASFRPLKRMQDAP